MASPSRAPLAALLFTVFLDLLGFGMVLPILPLYAKRFGASDVAVTALVASYSFMQLFFAPIWGRVSDRHGRRPVLLVSIFGSCISQLGYGLAPSFWLLVVARALAGVCGANISAAQAYIADSTDAESRAAGMGMLGAALGLGFVLGPMFGGLLGDIDHRLPFLIASALAAVNFLIAWLVLVEPRSVAERRASRAITWSGLVETVTAPRLRALIVLFFVITFAFAQLEGTFSLYLQRRFGYGERQVGYVFFGIGVVMIAVQGGLVPRLAGRVGERTLVLGGTLLMALGMALCFIAHDQVTLALSVVVVSLGNGINTPALASLISRSAEGDRQGGVLGVSQSFGALARVGGPLTGGWLLRYGPGAPYATAAAIMAVAVLWAWSMVQRPAGASTVPAPPATTGVQERGERGR